MKEIFEISSSNEKFNSAKFSEFFPEGEIKEVDIDTIPDEAMEFFEIKSQQYISRDKYKPKNFSCFYVVTHNNGDIGYVASQIKEYGQQAGTEELTYLADMRDKELTGYSEIRYQLLIKSDYFRDKPFVGFTHTEDGYFRQGLATRRLEVMNAITQMYYGNSVYSDTIITESAEYVWKKLVNQSRAKKIKEGKHNRYVFASI